MEEGKDSVRSLQGCETRGCGNGSQVLENGSCRCEHQIWTSKILYHKKFQRWCSFKNVKVCLFCTVLLQVTKKSNEYRYYKCTAISILILNVEKYLGSICIPLRYWSIFQYRYRFFFSKTHVEMAAKCWKWEL